MNSYDACDPVAGAQTSLTGSSACEVCEAAATPAEKAADAEAQQSVAALCPRVWIRYDQTLCQWVSHGY